MNALVDLALQYAKEHDTEIVTYAYEELKKLVEAKLKERAEARAAIKQDEAELVASRAEVDATVKALP